MLRFLGIFSLLIFQLAQAKVDPVVNWVENSQNVAQFEKATIWNPGLFFFSETQVRIETDRDGVFSDQSVRFELKPLTGMWNEKRLKSSEQRLRDLTLQEIKNDSRLQAYHMILSAWETQETYLLLSQSGELFKKAKDRANIILKNPSVDGNRFLGQLAFFVEKMTTMETRKSMIERALNSSGSNLKMAGLRQIRFLKPKELLASANKMEEVDLRLEEEQKALNKFEYEKKKSESYQFFRFVSLKKQRNIHAFEDYRVELAFRVPFLSDSLELESAKTEYIKKDFQYKQSKIEKKRILIELKSQLQGYVKKMEILSLLPDQSISQKLFSQSSFDSNVTGQVSYIKSKMDSLETRRLMFSTYLKILKLQGRLARADLNYLSQKP